MIYNYLFVLVVVCNAYSEPNGGFKLFMGRPNDKYGFIRPPVVNNNDESYREPEGQWFEQRVDHFNKQDNRTFKQLYYVDDTHHKTDGPVFLMIGGEGAIDSTYVTSMFMTEMAQKYGALAVALEHRYYGKSIPTPDLSTQNLKYLSSEMALKDTEQFALYLTKKLSLEGNKWVVFGGSYSGNLATWFREKYPNIAIGAIASSAPVGVVMDNMFYLGVMSELMGKECSDNIRKAHNEFEGLLKTPEGVIKLRKTLDLCQSFDGKNVDNNMYLAEQMVMFLGMHLSPESAINGVRKIMNDSSVGTPFERYAKAIGMNNNDQDCLEIQHSILIKSLQNTTIDPMGTIGMRQWLYQMCTEFGYFPTSDLPNSPFGHNIPVEYYIKQCTDIFGPQITGQTIQKGVDRTNANYGGLKPKVTNVVFPNGSLDPWHAISVLKDLNNSTKAVMIEGGDHCYDMNKSSQSDSQSMKNAHKLIEQQIGEYLN